MPARDDCLYSTAVSLDTGYLAYCWRRLSVTEPLITGHCSFAVVAATINVDSIWTILNQNYIVKSDMSMYDPVLMHVFYSFRRAAQPAQPRRKWNLVFASVCWILTRIVYPHLSTIEPFACSTQKARTVQMSTKICECSQFTLEFRLLTMVRFQASFFIDPLNNFLISQVQGI